MRIILERVMKSGMVWVRGEEEGKDFSLLCNFPIFAVKPLLYFLNIVK
jgi:hypothetical protein